jgi:hypothetical protein
LAREHLERAGVILVVVGGGLCLQATALTKAPPAVAGLISFFFCLE